MYTVQVLTVSHLAFMRSFSKRANSRRSWMVVSSFHSSRMANPTRTMAAMTPSTMPSIKTLGGHSFSSWACTTSSPASLYLNVNLQSSSSKKTQSCSSLSSSSLTFSTPTGVNKVQFLAQSSPFFSSPV